MPTPLNAIDQVQSAKLLGVILNSDLKFIHHVKYLLGQCSQKLYLLKLIRNQGLDRDSMTMICNAIIISRIQYVQSSWGGFLTADLACQINALFKRLFRYGFSNRIFNFSVPS